MFKNLKKKMKFYKTLIIEVLETLCTICIIFRYMNKVQHYNQFLDGHYEELKKFSNELRKEIKNEKTKI